MGWETAAILGFQMLSASNKIDQGKAEAEAFARQGEQEADVIAKRTVRDIGTLQTSFLQSGIALDDVGGTRVVFDEAAKKGLTDITRTIDNANRQAKNTYSAARTAALDSLVKGVGKTGIGSDVGGFLDDTTTDLWNGAGQEMGSWLDPSPVGPYRSPLSRSYY